MITPISSFGFAPGITGGACSPFNSTGANLIVLSFGFNAFGSGVNVTDNKGNTYIGLTQVNLGSQWNQIWYCLSPIVGTGHTITVDRSGGNLSPAVSVYLFSGVSSYAGIQNTGIGSGVTTSCGSVTPTVNGSLILAGIGGDLASNTPVISGFTGIISVPFSSGVNCQGYAAYQIQSVAGPVNPTWTWTGSMNNVTGSVAVFSPSAGPTVSESIQIVSIIG